MPAMHQHHHPSPDRKRRTRLLRQRQQLQQLLADLDAELAELDGQRPPPIILARTPAEIAAAAERWWTVQDLADHLRIRQETVRHHLRTGQLQGIQLWPGGPWRISDTAVNAWARPC